MTSPAHTLLAAMITEKQYGICGQTRGDDGAMMITEYMYGVTNSSG